VLTLRDLFQIVYEKKKKEMEEVKQQQVEDEKQDNPPPQPVDPNGRYLVVIFMNIFPQYLCGKIIFSIKDII